MAAALHSDNPGHPNPKKKKNKGQQLPVLLSETGVPILPEEVWHKSTKLDARRQVAKDFMTMHYRTCLAEWTETWLIHQQRLHLETATLVYLGRN